MNTWADHTIGTLNEHTVMKDKDGQHLDKPAAVNRGKIRSDTRLINKLLTGCGTGMNHFFLLFFD